MRKRGRLSALVLTLVLTVTMGAATLTASAATAPTEIVLKSTAATVDIGGQVKVSVKSVKPGRAGKAVSWTSSNKKTATVTGKGVVTGRKAGKVTITATSKLNNKVKGTYRISVKDFKAKKIKLNMTSKEVNEGDRFTLKATVSGDTGLYKGGVKWTSDNPDTATVSSGGVVQTNNAGDAVITASKDGKTAKCAVKVTRGGYNYVTANQVMQDIAGSRSVYTIIDVRQYVDNSGENMGSYTEKHILKAISAPVMNDEYKRLSDDKVVENLTRAGVSKSAGKKYVMVCYYGGEVAEAGVRVMKAKMGIDPKNIYILKGGQWSMDEEWSYMTDDPLESPSYLISEGSSNGGMAYHGVTPKQVKEDRANRPNVYKLIDVREAADYESAHIKGAVSAPVANADASGARAKANIERIVDRNADNTIYTIICYSGNAYADAATTLLKGAGVPDENITRIIGGHNAYKAAYPDNVVVGEYQYITCRKLNEKKSDYVVIDARRIADYYDSHIIGSVSADVSGAGIDANTEASNAAAKANIQAVVTANGADRKYAVICYTGNRFARAATAALKECGVSADNIYTVYGGIKQYKEDYAGDLEEQKNIETTASSVTIPVKVANNSNTTMHYVVSRNGSMADKALFNTNVSAADFYDALAALPEAKSWRDDNMPVSNSDFNGFSIERYLAEKGVGNADYSKFDIKVSWRDADGNTVEKTMAETLTGTGNENFEMIFANHKNNGSGTSGCLTCNTSCTFGIAANSKVDWGQPFAANTGNLPENGTVVYVTYTLK